MASTNHLVECCNRIFLALSLCSQLCQAEFAMSTLFVCHRSYLLILACNATQQLCSTWWHMALTSCLNICGFNQGRQLCWTHAIVPHVGIFGHPSANLGVSWRQHIGWFNAILTCAWRLVSAVHLPMRVCNESVVLQRSPTTSFARQRCNTW